jgi:hypothetical protein
MRSFLSGETMTSKYEVTKGMTFAVSDAPVTAEDFNSATFPAAGVTWLEAACATKEITLPVDRKGYRRYHAVLAEQEQTNGLAAPAEMSINRNWVGDEEAQEALQTAYENDELRALRVKFPSGNGFYVLVSSPELMVGFNLFVVGATYSLSVRGKPKRISRLAPERLRPLFYFPM